MLLLMTSDMLYNARLTDRHGKIKNNQNFCYILAVNSGTCLQLV